MVLAHDNFLVTLSQIFKMALTLLSDSRERDFGFAKYTIGHYLRIRDLYQFF